MLIRNGILPFRKKIGRFKFTRGSLGLCGAFFSLGLLACPPVQAASFPDLLTNKATVELPTGWTDTEAENNHSAVKMQKKARVLIHKTAVGGDGEFSFGSSNELLDIISVKTSSGSGESGFLGLENGSYSLFEEKNEGWTLKEVTCTDPDGGTQVNPDTGEVTLDIDPHEDVECRFVNQRNGSFTLRKISLGGDSTFKFITDLDVDSAQTVPVELETISGKGQISFDNLSPGPMRISEQVQTGWDLVGATCDFGSNNEPASLLKDEDGDGILDEDEILFDLEPAQNASCTFTNRRAMPEINVTKTVIGIPRHVGAGLFEVTMSIAVRNTGNTPVVLGKLTDDLKKLFGTAARVVSVFEPAYSENPGNFDAVLNSNFDGGTGLGDNETNLLSKAGKLLADQMVRIEFKVHFALNQLELSVENNAEASGVGSGITVSDISHFSDDDTEKGQTPTPIRLPSTGIVYNSLNLDPVPGALVSMADENGTLLPPQCLAPGQQGQSTGDDGTYRFDVSYGAEPACRTELSVYKIQVTAPNQVTAPKEYDFPSVIRPVTGDMLDVTNCALSEGVCFVDGSTFTPASIEKNYTYYLTFEMSETKGTIAANHIPLDVASDAGDFSIEKAAAVSSVSIGDVVPYTLTIRNETERTLSNFSVNDRLPVGLSYIAKSARLTVPGITESFSSEPEVISKQLLKWSFGGTTPLSYRLLQGNQSLKIDFQARVTATEASGKLKNTAFVENAAGKRVSNEAEAIVELRPEPIFHCASIMGRVFHDVNKDGILNHPDDLSFDPDTMVQEYGIEGAKLFTVNGDWFETDSYGRYSVPCATFPDSKTGSNYPLKLHVANLGKNMRPPRRNPQIVRLTAGVTSVVNFPVTQGTPRIDRVGPALFSLPVFDDDQSNLALSQQDDNPVTGPIYLAMFDITARKNLTKNIEAAEAEDPELDIDGRLALYLKGRIRGGAILTMMADTGEGDIRGLFNDFLDQDRKAYLKRIDPDRYYPVFGDDSKHIEDAPTSGKLYVRIEQGKNRAIWGSVRAELKDSAFVRANRIIYGGKLHLGTDPDLLYKIGNSDIWVDGGTRFGDARISIDAYGARAQSLKGRDRFRGHNGTVYYLQNADVAPGSETVAIEVRDPVTNIVKKSEKLVFGTEYSIDYILGRLILSDALPATSADTGVFKLNARAGDELHLVVDYSYSSLETETDTIVAGGRGEVWLTDHIALGANAQREKAAGSDFEILSADVTLKMAANSTIKAEVARSKGRSVRVRVSDDGGFSWDNEEFRNQEEKEANAVNVRLDLDIADFTNQKGKLAAYYERREAGFVDASAGNENDSEVMGLDFETNLTKESVLRATASHKKEKKPDGSSQVTSQANLAYGISFDDRTYYEGSLLYKEEKNEKSFLLGAKVETRLSPDVKVRLYGAAEVGDKGSKDESFIGAGATYDLFYNVRLDLDATLDMESEYQATAGLTWMRDEVSRYYLNYELGTTKTEGLSNVSKLDDQKIVLGGREKINDFITVSAEDRLYFNRDSMEGSSEVYHLDLLTAQDWHMGLGVERGNVSEKERLAVFGSIKTKTENTGLSLTAEYRDEMEKESQEHHKTYLGRGNLAFKSNDWRYTLNLEGMVRENTDANQEDGRYFKANLGAAYRPQTSDEWAALMMYTFLYDLPPEYQLDKGEFKQIANLFSAEASYRMNPRLRLTAKYGLKSGKQTTARDKDDWSKVLVQLGVLRADMKLHEAFEAMVEARAMSINDVDGLKTSLLSALYYRFDDNMKVGVGYNYGGVSSDLLDHTADDSGWFLNFTGAF